MSLLELQVTDLDQDVNFLFDQQVIQDERLLYVEETSDQVVLELVEVNTDLQGKITKFCELNLYSRFFFGFNSINSCEKSQKSFILFSDIEMQLTTAEENIQSK